MMRQILLVCLLVQLLIVVEAIGLGSPGKQWPGSKFQRDYYEMNEHLDPSKGPDEAIDKAE